MKFKFTPPRNVNKILILSNIVIALLLAIVLYKSQYYKRILVGLNLMDVHRIERPASWALKSWTLTLQKMDYKADVAFFGNSITEMSDFQAYFPDKRIVELGYSGDTMEGMMKRMDQLRAVNPDKVFLMAGINGIAFLSLDKFQSQYCELLDSIHGALPQAQVVVQSMLPVDQDKHPERGNDKIAQANQIIKTICNERHLVYVNLYDLYTRNGSLDPAATIDGLHLNPHGYDRWATAIRPIIEDE